MYKCHMDVQTSMESQFCENSEYVRRIHIGPQMNDTDSFTWESAEIAHAHPNSTCYFEAYRAKYGLQNLIIPLTIFERILVRLLYYNIDIFSLDNNI